MEKLNFGNIVLLNFPYTDSKTFKKRPALLIKDSEDGDIIVCRITSKIYNTKYDVLITDWENAGLMLPTVIRVHKIASLEKSMIHIILGHINTADKNKVRAAFKTLM